MRLISHRGNINGPRPEKENEPAYIQGAIALGYDVEIDVWNIGGNWFLGHDEPTYSIDIEFLKDERLLCHAKNLPALHRLPIIRKIIRYLFYSHNFMVKIKYYFKLNKYFR